jgi:hypothetical protein
MHSSNAHTYESSGGRAVTSRRWKIHRRDQLIVSQRKSGQAFEGNRPRRSRPASGKNLLALLFAISGASHLARRARHSLSVRNHDRSSRRPDVHLAHVWLGQSCLADIYLRHALRVMTIGTVDREWAPIHHRLQGRRDRTSEEALRRALTAMPEALELRVQIPQRA